MAGQARAPASGMSAPAARPFAAVDAALDVEVITTTAELEALEPEWLALWRQCPAATPFQSPAWLIPWWRHLGQGDLWVLALRHRGRLAGLAPLYRYRRPGASRLEVFLIGIATTDYLDALFAPGYERTGAVAVFAHLDGARHRWDVCNLQQLQPASALCWAPAPAGCW